MSEPSPTSSPALRVLVVNDDRAAAAAVVAALADAGLPAVIATDCDAALRAVHAVTVRLVVAELYVRCREGECVIAALRKDRHRLPQLRVLVHTRYTAPSDLAYALDNGADVIVPSTAPWETLLGEVRRLDVLRERLTAGTAPAPRASPGRGLA